MVYVHVVVQHGSLLRKWSSKNSRNAHVKENHTLVICCDDQTGSVYSTDSPAEMQLFARSHQHADPSRSATSNRRETESAASLRLETVHCRSLFESNPRARAAHSKSLAIRVSDGKLVKWVTVQTLETALGNDRIDVFNERTV